jgi:hypothetical protein
MHSNHAQIYTQVYTLKCTEDYEQQLMPQNMFRARTLLIEASDLSQRFELYFGNIRLFVSPCPVSQFLSAFYNLLIEHAFRENWPDERLGIALARFAVHAPAVPPGGVISVKTIGPGESTFTIIGDELGSV